MRVWVTRTQPQAEATAERLRRAGHAPVVQPVLVTRPLPGASVDLSGAAAIAFTSQNAVSAFARLSPRRDLPVFTTGDATAKAARDIGFRSVISAEGDVAALAALIIQSEPGGEVLWPGPTEPAGDLAALLAGAGVPARLSPVYETVPANAPAPADIDAVLVHSPKAARLIAGLIGPETATRLGLYAISPAAASPLKVLSFARTEIASSPDEAALLSLLDA